jgi:hypothetical protein
MQNCRSARRAKPFRAADWHSTRPGLKELVSLPRSYSHHPSSALVMSMCHVTHRDVAAAAPRVLETSFFAPESSLSERRCSKAVFVKDEIAEGGALHL